MNTLDHFKKAITTLKDSFDREDINYQPIYDWMEDKDLLGPLYEWATLTFLYYSPRVKNSDKYELNFDLLQSADINTILNDIITTRLEMLDDEEKQNWCNYLLEWSRNPEGERTAYQPKYEDTYQSFITAGVINPNITITSNATI